ncbi:MAG TPA: orotidine-5'-phosphate decarboxylase [Candidatus Cryosericum sp.]|nr:orotidine-5'-phosphate decarboxylase [Candidatus Cryosericum sp.]
MIMDKLAEAVAARGPVCVGLDTSPEYLPPSFRAGFEDPAEAVFQFNRRIVDATVQVCACYKLQIAYYEALGLSGMRAYAQTLQYVRARDRLAIADVKRGDIAATAGMYAAAHFSGDFEADFVTLSPYMGMDSIEPWLPWVREHDKGLFVLIRTSNPGATDIQYLEGQSGERVYTQVARRVADLGLPFVGEQGFSGVGGVVGCTHAEEARDLRALLSHTFFLVPGYGAQGGTARDTVPYFENGNGAVVNASRSILLAWRSDAGHDEEWRAAHFEECAAAEAQRMRDDIREALSREDA